MQWPIVCLFLIALLCLIQGLRKSTIESGPEVSHKKEYCAGCGWTTEETRDCQLEKGAKTVIVPLCFDCTIEQEAIPVKVHSEIVYHEVYV